MNAVDWNKVVFCGFFSELLSVRRQRGFSLSIIFCDFNLTVESMGVRDAIVV